MSRGSNDLTTSDDASSRPDELFFKWEIEDAVQIYSSKPAKRYLICTNGGYHPILQLLKDGTVAAVVRGGDYWVGERGRIELVISKDGGESWSQPLPIVTMKPDPCHWSFGHTSKGTLLVSFVQPHNYNNGVWDTSAYRFGPLYIVRSNDCGLTWSNAAIVAADSISAGCFNPYGKIVELADGTLLMGLYTISRDADKMASYTGSGSVGCSILRSQDDGITWGQSSFFAEGFVQPALLSLPTGKLIATLSEKDGN